MLAETTELQAKVVQFADSERTLTEFTMNSFSLTDLPEKYPERILTFSR